MIGVQGQGRAEFYVDWYKGQLILGICYFSCVYCNIIVLAILSSNQCFLCYDVSFTIFSSLLIIYI